MKKGVLIALLSALVGGLTAYAVVNAMTDDKMSVVEVSSDGAQFRTVNLAQDNWPDFTYAAESAVDAVVYVKVVSTQTQQQAPSSIFDFFFGFPECWQKTFFFKPFIDSVIQLSSGNFCHCFAGIRV